MLHLSLAPSLVDVTVVAPQAETAVGVAVGLGTTGAVAMATGNPLVAIPAGTAAGSAAAVQTGFLLRIMDCLGNPGQCSLSSN